MIPEERERLTALCERITAEKDPEIFSQLICELNDLLEVKSKRINVGPDRV